MTGAERIVFTLLSFAKSGHAAQLPQGGKPVSSSGQHFVRVALMRHVPNNVILGHVEDVVQGDGELRHSQRGGEVSAGFGDGFDDLPSQFVGELLEFFHVKAVHVVGEFDGV